MTWKVEYNNEHIKVMLSDVLKEECKIYFKVNDLWQEVYCGSIKFLEHFHKAYVAVCEILGTENCNI